MSSKDHKQYLFDNPRNVRFVVRALVAACILLVGLDLVLHRHAEHTLEEIFAFYAIYGFVGCVLMVFVVKFLGHHWLMKEEDYYD